MKEYSKTFCVYPWVHQQARPSGKINFCCISTRSFISDDNGQPMNLSKDSFQDAWNTSDMRVMRKQMIEGKEVSGCETCYKQEKIGKRSYRQSHNTEWADRIGHDNLENIVDDSIKNDFKVSSPVRCLDLRLGNLCNLKCRSCSPQSSVQIYNEWLSMDEKSNGMYSNFWSKYEQKASSFEPWYESDNFWNSVSLTIPQLEKVYMTGGEPTLIEGNFKFLKKCRELGFAQNIDLFFNTNLTNLKAHFLEELSYFRAVSINSSIDSFGEKNSYIRDSSRWSMVDKNFTRLASETKMNLTLGVSPVIQIYNILNITELLDYVETQAIKYNREILIDFLFCFSPPFLDIIHLPKAIKLIAIKRLEEFKARSHFYGKDTRLSFYVTNGINSTIQRLNDHLDLENSKMLGDFLTYTKTLDTNRKQNFASTFPELNKMFIECGYNVDSSISLVP